jgi:pimeloyl-ACP methyl ester carboxylesterase
MLLLCTLRVVPQVAALAAAGYYVIVPDMPGYGQSGKPSNVSAYSLKRVCSMLCGVLDAVGVQAACVVGHDWGAATAWALTLQQPQRVSKLVVLSVGHPGEARTGGTCMCGFGNGFGSRLVGLACYAASAIDSSGPPAGSSGSDALGAFFGAQEPQSGQVHLCSSDVNQRCTVCISSSTAVHFCSCSGI